MTTPKHEDERKVFEAAMREHNNWIGWRFAWHTDRYFEAETRAAFAGWLIARASQAPSAVLQQAIEALELALPRMAHRFECHSTRPTTEWPTHGSSSFENCACEINKVVAALSALRGLDPK